jgi:ankyrin repeat protein
MAKNSLQNGNMRTTGLNPVVDKITGNTALHEAAGNGDLNEVQVICNNLRTHGLSIKPLNSDEWLPFHVAIDRNHQNIIEFMLSIDPDLVNAQTAYGYTPLMLAAKGGHISLMIFLLKHGADPLLSTNGDDTALSVLCEKAQYASMESIQKLVHQDDYESTVLIGALHDAITSTME